MCCGRTGSEVCILLFFPCGKQTNLPSASVSQLKISQFFGFSPCLLRDEDEKCRRFMDSLDVEIHSQFYRSHPSSLSLRW